MTPTPESLWDRLGSITSVDFLATSQPDKTGWNGSGSGEVVSETVSHDCLIFSESGIWTNRNDVKLKFSNRYKWRLNQSSNHICLEHLRYGDDAPVVLFSIVQVAQNLWRCETSHQCNHDNYTLEISILDERIQMEWKITGPNKNTRLSYLYR